MVIATKPVIKPIVVFGTNNIQGVFKIGDSFMMNHRLEEGKIVIIKVFSMTYFGGIENGTMHKVRIENDFYCNPTIIESGSWKIECEKVLSSKKGDIYKITAVPN